MTRHYGPTMSDTIEQLQALLDADFEVRFYGDVVPNSVWCLVRSLPSAPHGQAMTLVGESIESVIDKASRRYACITGAQHAGQPRAGASIVEIESLVRCLQEGGQQ